MRVEEKGTDRKAEMHLYSHGTVQELQEFGQYIDDIDKAICCYVPVEEGMVIKTGGRFSGTTQIVAHDVAVDGIYRKAQNTTSQSVILQKNKKLDFDSFLYQTDEGIIDTDMKVARVPAISATQGDGLETLGTVEVRIYIVRRFGEEHSLGDVSTFHNLKKGGSKDHKDAVTYKSIAPDFKMTFEENCSTLNNADKKRLMRKMDMMRPGKKPWATFRFHYRSRDAIGAQEMELTHDAKIKLKSEAYIMEFEPVPELCLGAKPTKKHDADGSTAVPSAPATPSNSAKGVSSPAPAALRKKQPPRFSVPTPKKDNPPTPERSPNPNLRRPVEDDEKDLEVALSKQSSDKMAESTTSEATVSATESEKRQQLLVVNDATVADERKENGKITTKDQAPKAPSITNPNVSPVDTGKITTATEVNEEAKEPVKPATPPPDKAVEAPAPVAKPPTPIPTAVMLPAKRHAQPQLPGSPEMKRTKPASVVPPARAATASPTVPPISKGPTLAEKRKQLEVARRKRETLAKQRVQLIQKLAPYKQQMEEEIERINKELEEENRALAEEISQYKNDMALFQEFRKAEDAD